MGMYQSKNAHTLYYAVPKNIHSLLPQKGLEFLGGGVLFQGSKKS